MLTESEWIEYHHVCIELGQEEVSGKTYGEYVENEKNFMDV